MSLVLLNSILLPLSYYFMGLRLIALVAMIVVLLYLVGTPTGRFRHK
jgi:hypothetical protein